MRKSFSEQHKLYAVGEQFRRAGLKLECHHDATGWTQTPERFPAPACSQSVISITDSKERRRKWRKTACD